VAPRYFGAKTTAVYSCALLRRVIGLDIGQSNAPALPHAPCTGQAFILMYLEKIRKCICTTAAIQKTPVVVLNANNKYVLSVLFMVNIMIQVFCLSVRYTKTNKIHQIQVTDEFS